MFKMFPLLAMKSKLPAVWLFLLNVIVLVPLEMNLKSTKNWSRFYRKLKEFILFNSVTR
jgi:hypothetical protein